MRFLLATDDLKVYGQSYRGFPLLLDNDGEAMEPAQTWLWHILGRAGRIGSKRTWKKYGRDLFDYFAYLHANGIDWRSLPGNGHPGPLASYKEWSRGELGLKTSTINPRLRLAVRFYLWALDEGRIEALPFDYQMIDLYRPEGLLAHIDPSGGRVASPDVLLPGVKRDIKFLVSQQVNTCRSQMRNVTHRLMFDMMVRTGLRQEELRTFPESYLFDPSERADLSPGQVFLLHLDPRDMKTKGTKPRSIEMSYGLMEDLWWWSVRHRTKRARRQAEGHSYKTLFLTEYGEPYGDTALTSIFSAVSSKVGFKVTPHMLRHTYATYRLWTLRKNPEFKGEPLLYVRDRLGHSSVMTTVDYLHLINNLEVSVVLQHEDEIDKLFGMDPT